MDDLDAGCLERRHVLLRAAAGGLDDLDAAFPDGRDVFRIGRRGEGGRNVRFTPNGLSVMSRQRAISLASSSGVRCVKPGDDAEAARHSTPRRRARRSHVMHAALDDGMLDAEHLGDRCFHCLLSGLEFVSALAQRTGQRLPLLAEGTDFLFKRPGSAWLLIELPVGLGDRARTASGDWDPIRAQPGPLAARRPLLPHPFGVDAGVDHEMRDMDVLRPQFARHRLRHGAQAELGAGEGRKARCRRADWRCAR